MVVLADLMGLESCMEVAMRLSFLEAAEYAVHAF